MNHKATCTADRCRDWSSNGGLSVPGTQQPTRVISATRAPEHAEASSRPPGSPAKNESFQAWQDDPLSPSRGTSESVKLTISDLKQLSESSTYSWMLVTIACTSEI